MNDQEENQPAPIIEVPQEPIQNEVIEQMQRTFDRIQQMEAKPLFQPQ